MRGTEGQHRGESRLPASPSLSQPPLRPSPRPQLDFAPNAVTHLHRVGRTARAGASGAVTNIVGPESRELAASVRGQAVAGQPLAPIFSRNRGFRRRVKRYGSGLAKGVEGADPEGSKASA